LYNIFRNFGNVLRVIYMKEKGSGLVEFEDEKSAIFAKD
jgi:RNA recognition motif-containing protein